LQIIIGCKTHQSAEELLAFSFKSLGASNPLQGIGRSWNNKQQFI